ncbi:hypothetical protein ACLOJK_016541 [Asimina triloba]
MTSEWSNVTLAELESFCRKYNISLEFELIVSVPHDNPQDPTLAPSLAITLRASASSASFAGLGVQEKKRGGGLPTKEEQTTKKKRRQLVKDHVPEDMRGVVEESSLHPTPYRVGSYSVSPRGGRFPCQAREAVKALVMSPLQGVLSGSELVKLGGMRLRLDLWRRTLKLPTKEEVECALRTREVLDCWSEYSRTSIEGRKVVKKPLESFNMEAKAWAILVKFMPIRFNNILNLARKGLKESDAIDVV